MNEFDPSTISPEYALKKINRIIKPISKYEKINLKDALDRIGGLEEFFLPKEFPYIIPKEFDDLPRLLGRAKVRIKTSYQ